MKIFKITLVLTVFLLAIGTIFYINQPQEIEVSSRVAEITESYDNAPPTQEQEEMPEKGVVPEDLIVKEDTDISVLEDENKSSIKEIDPVKTIGVPFIVQAPFADWNERYKETCEEASVLMVDQFYKEIDSLTQQQMKDVLDPLTDWGDTFFSGRYDTGIDETSQYFTEYLGYDQERVKFIENPTIDELKALLANNLPIIVPAAGRELGNIYFQDPGPVYHMLVITGYDRDEFITNDPGTRNGEGYRYKQETLLSAIHDWTGNYDTIAEGRKIVMVITP